MPRNAQMGRLMLGYGHQLAPGLFFDQARIPGLAVGGDRIEVKDRATAPDIAPRLLVHEAPAYVEGHSRRARHLEPGFDCFLQRCMPQDRQPESAKAGPDRMSTRLNSSH